MAEKLYRYGEVYWIEFDEETVGTELKGDHPGLIISDDWYNEEGKRVIVLPCSTTLKPIYPFEVFIPNLANNGRDGKIMVDQVHSIDKERLGDKLADLPSELLEKVMVNLKELMIFKDKIKAKL